MLVLDLDGTAVRSDGTLSSDDIRAARMLADAGIVVTVATGRIFSGTAEIARALGAESLVACADGSELVDLGTGEVWRGCYLHPGDRAGVRDAFDRHGLSAAILTTNHVHHDAAAAVHQSLLRLWSEHLVPHPEALDAELWSHTAEVAAVLGLGDAKASERVSAELGDSHAALDTIFVRDYDGVRSFVKIKRAEVDKGTALATMAEERGFAPEQVVAVGDWHNDLPMLRVAGRSFAVRNAPEALHSVATDVLDAGKGEGGIVVEIARRVWGIELP